MRTAPTTTFPATTPDVESYLRIHRVLRVSARQLVAGLSRPADARSAAAIARWYRGYAGEITCHHHIEDVLLFPALAARVATYEEFAPQLESDHAELDTLLDDLGAALDRRDRPTAVGLATELRDHLDVHLGLEDDELVPMFIRHFTGAEYDELNARAVRMTSLRQMVFTAPWLLSHLDPEEQTALLATVPKALHVLWVLTRGRYARLVRAAFGGDGGA